MLSVFMSMNVICSAYHGCLECGRRMNSSMSELFHVDGAVDVHVCLQDERAHCSLIQLIFQSFSVYRIHSSDMVRGPEWSVAFLKNHLMLGESGSAAELYILLG